MAAIPTATKDNAINVVLPHFIDIANSKGAFLLREASLLNKARDYLKPDVKVKPQFVEDDPNPRATALTLLLQGAHKAQAHGSFNLQESATVFEIVELITKELADQKSTDVPQTIHKGNESDDDDTVDVRPISVTRGKAH